MRNISKEYIENTKKEIERLKSIGVQLVSFEEYCEMLKCFDLKLDLDPKNYFFTYYNTANSWGKWLECSTSAIDKTGHSFANIYGEFYQKHVTRRTHLYLKFQDFRNNYFTLYKNNYILQI